MADLEKDAGGKGRRLDSWKEIADYLKREVRSVQRWELERGLPIHRLPGRGRAVIFAYTGELDGWMKGTGAESNRPPGPEPECESVSLQQAVHPEVASRLPPEAEIKPVRSPHWVAGRMWPGFAVALILAVSYWVAIYARRAPPQAAASRTERGRRMLAVLPFENLSADPSQEYFADGLTEEMITDLGRLNPQSLGVIARTSAMKYKGTREDVGQIGRELGVSYILEGSVRREGDQARVSAQLIQVSDQTHLWAQNYELQVKNILSVQQNVAEAIADKIRVNLDGGPRPQLTPSQPASPEAYDDYLEGLYFFNRRNPHDFEESVKFFTRATREDPNYAPAQAGLARCDALLALQIGSAQKALEAKAAAARAIELDSSSVEALTALAGIRAIFDYDWPGAETAFRRALNLNPNYAPAHHWYANLYLDPQGRVDEAIVEMKRAQEVDPLSLIINTDLGYAYYLAGQSDTALHQYQKVLEMDPAFYAAHFALSDIYLRRGMYDEWLSEYLQAVRLSGHPDQVQAIEELYKTGGYRAVVAAEAHMTGPFGPHRESRVYGTAAQAYMELGNKERALALLEESYARGERGFVYLKVDPLWFPLHSDPRFQGLARKMGLALP